MRALASRIYDNAYVLMTLTAFFWGGNFVLGRGIADQIPPIALACLRWSFATLIFAPFAIEQTRKDWPEIIRNRWIILFLGIIGGGTFNTMTYIGLGHTTALNALVIQSSGPVLIMIAAYLVFSDRVSMTQLAGITLSLSGVLWVITSGRIGEITGLEVNPGDLIILFAFMTWAIYTIYLRKRPDIHWMSFILMLSLIAALVNIPIWAYEHFAIRQIQPTLTTFLTVTYVAIFQSVLAFIFFNRSVELIGANRTGVFMHLVPVFGTILAILLLGEHLQSYHLIGFGLIISGVIFAAR